MLAAAVSMWHLLVHQRETLRRSLHGQSLNDRLLYAGTVRHIILGMDSTIMRAEW